MTPGSAWGRCGWRWLGGLGLAVWALGGPLPAAAQATGAGLTSLLAQSARWVEQGHDDPDGVSRQMAQATAPEGVGPAQWARVLARSRGMVAARAGRLPEARQAANALQRLAAAGDPLAQADEAMVLALLEDQQWHSEAADQQARIADEGYTRLCGDVAAAPADCDPRPWWRVLRLLAGRAEAQGHLVAARSLQQRAHDLAQVAGLGLEQAWSLSSLAVISQALGEVDAARRQMAQADRLATREPGPEALVRVRINEARLADARGDADAVRRTLEEARRLARPLGSVRLNALILANLADAWLQVGRPRDALAAATQALPVVRRFGDMRSEPMLLHNGGLARLALGQLHQARADLDAAAALWERAGATGQLRAALRQYADALAAAGDLRAALEMYHREMSLAAQLSETNRAAVLQELRQRYRSEADQRELDHLGRENALKAERLTSQQWTQRIWALGGALLLMALVGLGMLVKRTRDANQQLRRSEALLKVQSQRDTLTGLANRRHFREVLEAAGATDGGFVGALLLLDIDHFKRINDQGGHSTGDQVLAGVADRLAAGVRSADLACRWGGEEFLVHAPALLGDDLDALARRLLHAIGDEPLVLRDGQRWPVSVSIGYASFPLPAHGLSMGWEQAVNLVDMALYTAKALGRDGAVGLESVAATSPAELDNLGKHFEQARQDGRVRLKVCHRQANAAGSA
jgi:diguanylate cyclase (GGDEF)-like protein